MTEQRFSYGGQAVFEGVMMRGRRQATVAVRTPDGEITFYHEPLDAHKRSTWERLPLLRGVLLLWDTLNLGMRSMFFALEVNGKADEQPLSKGAVAGTVALSLVLAIGLFVATPSLLASLASWLGAPHLVSALVDGVASIALVIGYMGLLGRLPEARRLYGYHGAEHKTINAYEAGAPLTVDSVRRFSLIHPRCGTSFLLVVVVLGIGLGAGIGWMPYWARLVTRIACVPLIAAVAFELLRLSAANYHRAWVRRLVAPSLALQRLTTREPDDTMIETAIAALAPVLAADGVQTIALPERRLAEATT
jgi:uncharacterized protein YqhQ